MKRLNVVLAALAILIATSSTGGATLVANGGLETGDFSGWTITGNSSVYVDITNSPEIAQSWTYGAIFGPEDTPGSITQDIATAPGQPYSKVNQMSVVPIPGAIWLFGSGLAGLVGIGRWRRRR